MHPYRFQLITPINLLRPSKNSMSAQDAEQDRYGADTYMVHWQRSACISDTRVYKG